MTAPIEPIERSPYPEGFNPYLNLIYGEQLRARLAVYGTDGSPLGTVEDPVGFTWYDRLGEIPTLAATWTEAEPNHLLLEGPCYVALELLVQYRDGAGGVGTSPDWFEYRNSRFFSAERTWDRRDITKANTGQYLGVLGILSGVRVWNVGLSEDDQKRHFKEATPGAIIATLVAEAKDRGEAQQFTLGFDATHDSFGAPWPTVTRAYEASTDIASIIQDLHASGVADFWLQGMTLHMSVPGEWDRRFNGDPWRTYIRDGVVPASPERIAWTNTHDKVMVQGEGVYWATKTNPNASTPFGSRTKVIKVGGVTDLATAEPILDMELAQGEAEARTWTREWVHVDDMITPEVPLRNFSTGDIVFMDTAESHKVRLRVQDMSIELANNGSLNFFTTVGDLRSELLTRMSQQVKATNDSASVAATGKPTPPSRFESHPGQQDTGLKLTLGSGFSSYTPQGLRNLYADPNTGEFRAGFTDTVTDPDTGKVYAGTPALRVNGETGKAELNGVFRSSNYTDKDPAAWGLPRPFIEIDDDSTIPGSSPNRTQIAFHTRPDHRTTTGSPRIFADLTGSDQRGGQAINVASGKSDSGYSALRLSPGVGQLITYPGGTPDAQWPDRGTGDSSVEVRGRVAQLSSAGLYGTAFVTASSTGSSGVTYGVSTLGARDMNGVEKASFSCDSLVGQAVIKGSSLSAPAIQASTTAGLALQRGASGPVITYVSSSKVNKLDRERLTPEAATAMLEVTPITWRDRAEVEADAETTARQVGFTVEDVAEVSERHGGLLEPVILRDEDGKPVSLAYDRMPDPFTLELFRQIMARLDALEARDT